MPTEYTGVRSIDGKGIAHDDFEECVQCGAHIPWSDKARAKHLRTHEARNEGSGLDAAWAAAVAAQKPGAFGPFVGRDHDGERFVAWTWYSHGPDAEPIEAFGITPTAALQALAARLSKKD